MIKDLFVTKERNSNGIYGVQFFIRGKPWVVDVDDEMLFDTNGKLVFSRVISGMNPQTM